MKAILDWQNKEVVNVFDEATLWAAPFGRLLLENIPMQAQSKILDIGFGTGLPLIELSQRYGADSAIYGIDIWKEGIEKAKEKIAVFELNNIQIFEQSATVIPLENESIDLVTSNLGVNNFEEKEKVLQEIYRVLKKEGRLAITTNPVGTFDTLFDLFAEIFEELNWEESKAKLQTYIHHRGTESTTIKEFEKVGFTLTKRVADNTNMRFVNAEALLNHVLIRIGFRAGWDNLFPTNLKETFYQLLIKKIDHIIQAEGEFKMSIPMLYLEFGVL